jgi:transcriptional regulator with XRE-family HTH domain
MKTIGEFIAGRRKQLSLSQKELVALIKNRDGKPLSMPYLSYLENSRGEPPGVTARPWLAYLPPARGCAAEALAGVEVSARAKYRVPYGMPGGRARAPATDRGGGQALELQPSPLTR